MDEDLNWYDFQVLHPYFGYTLDPNRTPFPTDEFGFPNTISPVSLGAPDSVRVGVTGGSVAMFLAAKYGHILRDEISVRCGLPAERVEVVNLAQGGYKQPQQLMVLNFMLMLGARFDFLINLDGFNEMALHPCENGTKDIDPSYPRNWYFTVDPFKSSAERLLAARIQVQKERMKALEVKRQRQRFSPVQAIIRILERATADEIHRLEDQFRQTTFADLSYQTKGRGRTYEDDDGMFRQLADLWKNSSALMDNICRGRAIAYHHFLQPNQYFAGTKTFTLEERTLLYQPDHPYRYGAEQGYSYLVQACKQLGSAGVRATDMSAIFRDIHETTYIDSCCHLNELGNRMVARSIASTLSPPQKSG